MRASLVLIIVWLCALTSRGQQLGLAQNYLDHGEYVKAEAVFKDLYADSPTSIRLLEGLVKSQQAQEKYAAAEQSLKQFAERIPGYPGINVEIGHNYTLQNDKKTAAIYYQKAIQHVKSRPNFAYSIGERFQNYNLINEAINVYTLALQAGSNPNFTVELAQLYGMQGQLEQMFTTFLNLIIEQPRYYYAVNRYFSQYITADPEHDANQILRTLLLKRMQQQPEALYNRVLSWLYVQQNEFAKAFVQEKALYARAEYKNLSGIMQLAQTAKNKSAFEAATMMYQFVLTKAPTSMLKINAAAALLQIEEKTFPADKQEQIKADYQNYLEQFGYTTNSLKLQLQYARFLGFIQHQPKKGVAVLKQALQLRLNQFEEARVKLTLGDLLVAQNKFSQALINYSQIQYLAGESPLTQEALFKVAQTSYFKGDFDWAQTQLKVLKQAVDQRTANDALALNLLIEENKSTDSTKTALQQFAKADLLQLQGYPQQALNVIDTLLAHYPKAAVQDDALLRLGRLNVKLKRFQIAQKAYEKLIKTYPESVLQDDALFALAELCQYQLQNSTAAKNYYKTIIFDHPDSIFLVQARKAFRELRGE